MTSLASTAGTALTARLDKVIDDAVAAQRIVGTVVLVARDGQLIYHRSAGLADREARRPIAEDDIFRLSSLTKSLVTAAAMQLIEAGTLQMSDPVTKWLPEFRPRLSDGIQPVITIRQLLTHTSGLTYGFMEPAEHPYHRLGVSDGMDQSGISLDENLRRLADAPLSYAPGSSWRYSLAMDVIGAVVQKAANATLSEVTASRVTEPLGMTETAFVTKESARVVTPYASDSPSPTRMTDDTQVPVQGGSVVRFSPSRAFDAAAYPSGGTGMVGTARDFLTFLECIRLGGAPILEPDTVHAMMSEQIGPQAASQGPGWAFGYGWAVLDDPALAKTPQAKGTIHWVGAYGHTWFVDPANKVSVVALTNTTLEGMFGRFPNDVRSAVYGQ